MTQTIMTKNINKYEPEPPVDILYVGGWGRSGSTLLTRMLAELPEFVAVGEVRDVFLRGIEENRVCGCGDRFSSCEFWQAVGQDAYGGWDKLSISTVAHLRKKTDKPWHVPALLNPGLNRATDSAVDEYGDMFLCLYRSIRRISGAKYIVDASKIASFAAILQRVDGLSPKIVHLVRDPRGTLNSWMKQVRMVDDLDRTRYMPRYSLTTGAMRYLGYNVEMHMVGKQSPSLFMRYEDLIEQPEENIREILRFAGVESHIDLSGFIGPQGVNLGSTHTIAGNPMRHQSGWIPLRSDDSWRIKMPRGKQLAVAAMTYPLIQKYGYEKRARSHGGSNRTVTN